MLKADLERFEIEDDGIVLCPTIRDFLQRHVEPSDEALAQGQALLADNRRRAALMAEIESGDSLVRPRAARGGLAPSVWRCRCR